jgi:hypothetical protein
MPKPPMPYKTAIDPIGPVSMVQAEPETVIPPALSRDERLYNELLFDYTSVRRNW